ncbi:oxygen-independent coproporphyrinogen III oxidase [Leeia sp. TBRC 13508]|uniref:Coproporphyrinogen-III oxidase n=1 Tax=Leeia speluncae TaxID=2884804 RepID=A0ABS8D7K0_9NEIS|nr:oxygen-independent coproporphyrinogen III oxidase [Leeia speluncae]MCB6183618.1 oxygen-independent coproporphyrinogen III oxidase [Leeia speluncae]
MKSDSANIEKTQQDIIFDKQLIERLSGNGPRYTSYPTADRFHEGFTQSSFEVQAKTHFLDRNEKALSLYVHIPFCNTICYYCACNKIITKDKSKADQYLDYLDKEIDLVAPHFAKHAKVEQLHFGGGTPTFLSDAQLTRLIQKLKSTFQFADDTTGEFSIEIDPRKVSEETVALLRQLGFNRMSIGVQDFDADVQVAVNRIQSEEETLSTLAAARKYGFQSVSMDLIYGLPLQTVERFSTTLDKVIAARPDRLSVYNYAHLPHAFMPQRRINEADLPSADTKLDILNLAIQKLTAAGYIYIGMDHFALPNDELAIAQTAGTLHRNFQGYSTHDDIDMLALGVSAISKIGTSYSQNVKTTEEYYAALDKGTLPLYRGMDLTEEDVLRRDLIQRLMCDFEVDIQLLEKKYGISYLDFFSAEQTQLQQLAKDGLLSISKEAVYVQPKGRLLIRNIAMVFDQHLREKQTAARYSKVI